MMNQLGQSPSAMGKFIQQSQAVNYHHGGSLKRNGPEAAALALGEGAELFEAASVKKSNTKLTNLREKVKVG